MKNHEVICKVRALKLSSFVEELVKEDFPCGSLSMDGDGIDYELCLHQDFLFMLRQRSKASLPKSSGTASNASSHDSNMSAWDEKPLCPSDIIL